MKSKIETFIRSEWLQILILIIPILAALVAMPFATERVPMQWNMKGEVNWYAPKSWGLFVTPVTVLLAFAFVLFKESRDSARYRDADGALTAHGKATRLIRLGISILLGAVALVQISASLGHQADVGRFVLTSVALLFAFMGNLFGKLKPNRYVGVRVPWTLNSEHVWRQTHRVAGWIWTVSSLIVATLSWLLPIHIVHERLAYMWLFFLIVPPLFVAWNEARKERRTTSL
ncbi:putative membrane protein [Prosthecobacter fusiformis]|uniref:Putative membrane protein n=1 Tax=Prosthecobacter fusiformis TaxID=48464 RepID=A0A4V3FFI6_9BACT|nr:SdpI family protein [Prosthecobacter fusiformis]TDU70613.1 putative membrane protein [Prosthecobacter fusiformis]